ncbi:SDR family oxidoreductase [Opitutales bacterium ASA1]|nr:SDR family oxidoreductase [Opitutales bacterium ASA1]
MAETTRVRRLAVDLSAETKLEIPPGTDTVFHLAGKAHALSELGQDEAEYQRVNRDGTRRLLEASRTSGVRAFVFMSTVKVVGDPPRPTGHALDEAADFPPENAYGRSKREAEELVLRGGYVPHPVVLRPALVFGAGVKGNLQTMLEAVSRNRFPPIPEVGNKRSLVHVADLVDAALLAARTPEAAGKCYIVADPKPCSSRELYDAMRAALGRIPSTMALPQWTLALGARLGDVIGKARGRRFVFDSQALSRLVGDAWYSSERIRRELGWQPRRTLAEGLAEMVATMR